jgi:hypothetical protein
MNDLLGKDNSPRSWKRLALSKSEKQLKASNYSLALPNQKLCFLALVRIGTFKRTSRYPGDIIAKFDWDSKIVSWEIIYNTKVQRIQIPFASITNVRVDLTSIDGTAILELNLNKEPEASVATFLPHAKLEWAISSKALSEGDDQHIHWVYMALEDVKAVLDKLLPILDPPTDRPAAETLPAEATTPPAMEPLEIGISVDQPLIETAFTPIWNEGDWD